MLEHNREVHRAYFSPLVIVVIPFMLGSGGGILCGLLSASVAMYLHKDALHWGRMVGTFTAVLIFFSCVGYLFFRWTRLENTITKSNIVVANDNEPVRVSWIDEDANIQLRQLDTVTNAEFREIAALIVNGHEPSSRLFDPIIGGARTIKLRKELKDRKYADWNVYGADFKPVKSLGWHITENGMEFCKMFFLTTSPSRGALFQKPPIQSAHAQSNTRQDIP